MNPETGRVRGVSPHRLRDAFCVHAMKINDSDDALRLLQGHLGQATGSIINPGRIIRVPKLYPSGTFSFNNNLKEKINGGSSSFVIANTLW